MPKTLRCFKPFIDKSSLVLILGTMPGPTALRKREYYGFSGNHFWKIIFRHFGIKRPLSYPEKINLLRKNRIALWDVFGECIREGALDQSIQKTKLNPIPEMLKKFPNVKAILLNGRTSEKTFRTHFEFVSIPAVYVPSTSPAHAGLSFEQKYRIWAKVLRLLE